MTFEKYELRIKEIKKEPDWGEDLPIFNQLTNKSIKWITRNNYLNEQFYFIYAESVNQEKLIDFNYYSYFMSTIIISIPKTKVMIINHGED